MRRINICPRPSDLTDERALDAIVYRNRNGCTWRALPHEIPRWRAADNGFLRLRETTTASTTRFPIFRAVIPTCGRIVGEAAPGRKGVIR